MSLPANVPWLVAVLLFVFFGPPAIASKSAAKLPGWAGAVGRWWQGRKHELRVEVERSKAWQAQDAEISRLARAYDKLSEDHNELQQQVNDIDDKLTAMTKRFFSALDYIRRLSGIIRRIDPEHEIPEPPESLTEYLGA